MKKLAFFSLLLFGVTACFAQTKLIAHKRHSGNDFQYALVNNTSDIKNSNFGVAPTRSVQIANLDSVIYIDNERAIMVTSGVCKEFMPKDSVSLWKPGRDTVYNHELFSKPHKLDSIKAVLKDRYYFKNDIEKVVFIGYDNGKKVAKKKKKQFVPLIITPKNNKDKPNGFNLHLLVLSVAFVFSVVVYWGSLKNYKQITNA